MGSITAPCPSKTKPTPGTDVTATWTADVTPVGNPYTVAVALTLADVAAAAALAEAWQRKGA